MTRVAAALSTLETAQEAGADATGQVAEAMQGAPVDLGLVFLTPDLREQAGETVAAVREMLAPRHLVGCVAQGVVAGTVEAEAGPAVAVWAAALPGAQIETFHAEAEDDDVAGLPDLAAAELVLLIADPYSFSPEVVLARAAEEHPGVPIVGGIAIGGGAGEQLLALDGELHDGGAVGAVLRGVNARTAVSQGCAPLGRDLVVTRAEGNVVFELAGQPALERLRETIAALSPREQALASRGILAGLVIDENKPEYGRGDYLMRPILGADEESGALAVGEHVRVGQTLRFHARDAESAHADLELALDEVLHDLSRPEGALLFTCNGRGVSMFGARDHDAGSVVRALGRPSLAGFFCGGEIGPVGGRSFLHGFTATMVVFGDEADATR